MSKQTAVKWLLSQIFKHNNLVKGDGWFYVKPDIIDQAKAMEKEQIEDAHIEGQRVFDKHPHTQWTNDQAEQYYNETYGGENE